MSEPFDPDALDLEAGRLLFAQACDFVRGVPDISQLPPDSLPEVAFAGRSNVGKSSLVNALTGRKTLARVSNTPGRTQQLNFFRLGSPSRGFLMLVDLPGYGYAKVSRTQSQGWTRTLKTYLRGRASLRRVLLLIDARHGFKDGDRDIMSMLDEAAVSFQVVLTKADKVKPGARERAFAPIREELRTHVAAHPRLVITSSETGEGVEDLRAELTALAVPGEDAAIPP